LTAARTSVDFAISRHNLVFQSANIPALAFKLVELRELLSLLFIEMVKIWMH
jgi:hypothetical protein